MTLPAPPARPRLPALPRVATVSLACVALLACGPNDDRGPVDGAFADSVGRLLLSTEDGTLHVVDLPTGEALARYELGAPAQLFDTGNGRHFVALTSGAAEDASGAAHFFDGGVSYTDHVDHDHVRLDPPRRIPLELTGARPGRVISNQGKTVVHFDGAAGGSGEAVVVSRPTFNREVPAPQVTEFTGPGPVAGLALPFAGFLLVSTGPEGAEANAATPPRPSGFRITDFANETYATFDGACAGLRDAAPAGNAPRAVVACEDRIVAVESLGALSFELVPLAGAEEAGAIARLRADRGLPWVLGLDEAGARWAWIDPLGLEVTVEAGPAVRFAGVEARADPDGFVLVTEDGAIWRARGPGQREAVAPPGTLDMDLPGKIEGHFAVGYHTLFAVQGDALRGVDLDTGVEVAVPRADATGIVGLALSGPARVPLGDMGIDDL